MRCDSPRPVRVSREARHHPHLHRGVRAIQARCVAPDSQGAVLGSGPRSCPCTWGHGEGTIRVSLRGYSGVLRRYSSWFDDPCIAYSCPCASAIAAFSRKVWMTGRGMMKPAACCATKDAIPTVSCNPRPSRGTPSNAIPPVCPSMQLRRNAIKRNQTQSHLCARACNSDELPLHIEHRPAVVTRIDRRVHGDAQLPRLTAKQDAVHHACESSRERRGHSWRSEGSQRTISVRSRCDLGAISVRSRGRSRTGV